MSESYSKHMNCFGTQKKNEKGNLKIWNNRNYKNKNVIAASQNSPT